MLAIWFEGAIMNWYNVILVEILDVVKHMP